MVHEFFNVDTWVFAVEQESLSLFFYRIVTEEGPVTRLHGIALLVESMAKVVAMGNAMAVGNDQRGSRIGFGFLYGLQCMHIIGSHGDLCHIGGPVSNGLQGKVFFTRGLSFDGKLGTGTDGC